MGRTAPGALSWRCASYMNKAETGKNSPRWCICNRTHTRITEKEQSVVSSEGEGWKTRMIGKTSRAMTKSSRKSVVLSWIKYFSLAIATAIVVAALGAIGILKAYISAENTSDSSPL